MYDNNGQLMEIQPRYSAYVCTTCGKKINNFCSNSFHLQHNEDMETEKLEGWEKLWEDDNAQVKGGVNPHAYRLGFLAAKKLYTEEERDNFALDFMEWWWNFPVVDTAKSFYEYLKDFKDQQQDKAQKPPEPQS